ncbi:hypothetical protein [Pleionea sp. CnH1-48]|uniref:hypothetical protein n=1 Tax=Pleionea sp. CnH1-48 TaxID=2954494 RepID=UPI002096B4EA|nr:hypothetical protein [Pleionea sp. CnH1-48]MCO7225294.1 hypothetical protein [Pleionea sp. CnH1-48]
MISTIINYQTLPIKVYKFNNETWLSLKNIAFIANIEKPIGELIRLVRLTDSVVSYTNQGGLNTDIVITASEALDLVKRFDPVNAAYCEVWLENIEGELIEAQDKSSLMDLQREELLERLNKSLARAEELKQQLEKNRTKSKTTFNQVH